MSRAVKLSGISLLVIFLTTCSSCNGVRYISTVTPSYDLRVGVQRFSSFPPEFIAFPQNVDYQNNFQRPTSEASQTYEKDQGKERDGSVGNYEKGGVGKLESMGEKYPNSTQIPLSIIEKLNQYTNVEDVFDNIVEEDSRGPPDFIANRFGETDEEERSAAIKPKPANCIPELTTVKLIESDDPSVVYFPSCTRIEQCGGCCKHPLLACTPTEMETVNFMVHMFQYNGGQKLKFVRKEIVPMERHLKCECGCKMQEQVKESDCNRFQKYSRTTCSCTCPNTDEKEKCLREVDKKLWNPKLCSCQCREILECSTGHRFDTRKCQCIEVNLRRRYVQTKERGFDNNALTVVPLYEVQNVNNN